MTFNGWLQIAVYVLLILAVTKPLGIFMARVFAGERTFLTPALAPVERGFYALAGVDARREQHWTTYSFALLLFSVVSYLVEMAALTVQNFVSAAACIAIAIALTRGFARSSATTIGNFWVDLTRATLYILLPMSIVVALLLVALGV